MSRSPQTLIRYPTPGSISTLGVSGLILCYTLYKAKLVPGWLAVGRFVGYATILVGMLSAIMGSGLGDLSSLPGGLWEMFIGVWLIVKGFNSSAVVSQAARTGNLQNRLQHSTTRLAHKQGSA